MDDLNAMERSCIYSDWRLKSFTLLRVSYIFFYNLKIIF